MNKVVYQYNGILFSNENVLVKMWGNEWMNETTILFHFIISKNIENIIQSEWSQTQKTTYGIIPFMGKSRIGKYTETKSRLVAT